MIKWETRRVIQRGPKSGAVLLPQGYMEENGFWHGTPMKVGMSQDGKRLYIINEGEFIKITNEPLKNIKSYMLGIHKIKDSRGGINCYPIITVPQVFMQESGAVPTTKVDIWRTDQKNVLMITKEGEYDGKGKNS